MRNKNEIIKSENDEKYNLIKNRSKEMSFILQFGLKTFNLNIIFLTYYNAFQFITSIQTPLYLKITKEGTKAKKGETKGFTERERKRHALFACIFILIFLGMIKMS